MSKIYGLLGEKLSHSLSVPIHNALGNMDYKLFELKECELEAFLRQPNLGGVNVTIPYKQAVMPFLDEISPEARAIGAVNTVVNHGGRLYGYNTDKDGFLMMVKESGIEIENKKVMILGNGGASKTAVYCCESLGAREIVIIGLEENNPEYLSNHKDTEVIVNCTPVGMKPNYLKSAVELSDFPACEGVIDLIYNPLRTKLIMDAQAKGLKAIGGLIMLTSQAKRAHEYFFDTEAADEFSQKCARDLWKQNENIVLVGMPGCGKTTVGKLLAEISGREYVEIDEEIVKASGKTIPEIFAQEGEEGFRKLESALTREASCRNGIIIITGGGVVTRQENYYPLHQNSRIYEIKRDIDSLATDGRPLSAGGLDTLKEMYKKRKPMYDAFKDVSIANDADALDTAKKIWEEFCEVSCY
ncbi:MAG: AAA family ATPase [Oscillospiraceae bacterium]|nr:AAA family ATPase [Oscillospiraceae bacterium]